MNRKSVLYILLILALLCTGCGSDTEGATEKTTRDSYTSPADIFETEPQRSTSETSSSETEVSPDTPETSEDTAAETSEDTAAETSGNTEVQPEDSESTEEHGTESDEGRDTESTAAQPSDIKLEYINSVTATDQMILVVGDSENTSEATTYFYQKNGDEWECLLECFSYVGENGISYNTYEGDRTTPAGVFDMGLAFGNYENPGTDLDWVDVNEYLYWVDDVESEYYDQLIDSREIPDGWNSAEHLIDFWTPYAYAIYFDVNPPYTTSAVFFHCFSGNPYTGGCVAVSEENMIWVLQNIHKGAMITIVRAEDELAAFLACG